MPDAVTDITTTQRPAAQLPAFGFVVVVQPKVVIVPALSQPHEVAELTDSVLVSRPLSLVPLVEPEKSYLAAFAMPVGSSECCLL